MVGNNALLQFSKGEEEIADLFWDIGLKKNTARVLVLMIRDEDLTSRDIERICDLRQPEVSIALSDLMKRKWVKDIRHAREGKGRPTMIYHLVKSLDDILEELKTEIVGDYEEKLKEIEKVRDLLKANA
jgi:predicted transcriptional regulator